MDFIRNINTGRNKSSETNGPATSGQSKIAGLIKKAAGGDFEAFGELYNTYLERIYRYIFYQVRDKMTAEDLTEEVFLKAWRAIDSCQGKEDTFSSWLYRIAHNHVIDSLRSQRKYLSADIEALAKTHSPEPEAGIEVERQEMLDAISDLPQNQKQVIILKFIDGLDNQEIGQVMGKRQGAIRALQMRALATLRQKLSGEI